MACLCEEFGVKKQTVCDIRRSEAELEFFSQTFGVEVTNKDSVVNERKHMAVEKRKKHENAVYRWFLEQCSVSLNVHSLNLRSATKSLAQQIKLKFEPTDVWFKRFCLNNGVTIQQTSEECFLEAPLEKNGSVVSK